MVDHLDRGALAAGTAHRRFGLRQPASKQGTEVSSWPENDVLSCCRQREREREREREGEREREREREQMPHLRRIWPGSDRLRRGLRLLSGVPDEARWSSSSLVSHSWEVLSESPCSRPASRKGRSRARLGVLSRRPFLLTQRPCLTWCAAGQRRKAARALEFGGLGHGLGLEWAASQGAHSLTTFATFLHGVLALTGRRTTTERLFKRNLLRAGAGIATLIFVLVEGPEGPEAPSLRCPPAA